MKNAFNNDCVYTIVCPKCGKTGVMKCKENIELELESDEVNTSIHYIYPTAYIYCNHCNIPMIQCSSENEVTLMTSIIDLGFCIESYSKGRMFSKDISMNMDTGIEEITTQYIHPILSIYIPIDDPKRCIAIIKETKSIFDGNKDISYEFYAEYDDCIDHDYRDLDHILDYLHSGDIDFDWMELNIYCNKPNDAVIDDSELKRFDSFIDHCLNLMNTLKELDV